ECRERRRSLEIDLQRTLTELQKEQSERRRLEEQIRHLKEPAVDCHDDQNRSSQKDWELRLEQTERKFVVVLIDADAYKFCYYFTRDNEAGAYFAADELRAQIRRRIRTFITDPDEFYVIPDYTDVVVRAYANLRDLGRACWREMRTDRPNMRSFASGFSMANKLFDFVDVGPGKDLADRKITEMAKFYLNNEQCQHVFLGICHDGGYIPFLQGLAKDDTKYNRVTLIYGPKVARKYRDLDWPRTTELPTVFSSYWGAMQWQEVQVDFCNLEKQDLLQEDIMWQRMFYQRNGREDPTAISLAEIAAQEEGWLEDPTAVSLAEIAAQEGGWLEDVSRLEDTWIVSEWDPPNDL
ncbi:MAG: hypothetical protein L6R42_004952, partial [Xanthoria sp. 1 TBL-2021]